MPGYTIRVKASVEREIAALPRDVVATAPAALRNTWRALTDTPEGREKVIDLILRLPEFMKYEQCIHGSKTTAPPTTSALFGDRAGPGPCPGAHRRVSAVILYGSFARGDFHEGSDIVGDFRERPHRRAATILGLTDRTALLH